VDGSELGYVCSNKTPLGKKKKDSMEMERTMDTVLMKYRFPSVD
jgi:hypothetical protein